MVGAIARLLVQVTVFVTAVQFHGLPVGSVPGVNADASRISITLSPCMPSGSPVDPIPLASPLFMILNEKLAPGCPCCMWPLGGRPVWPLLAETVTGFSRKFMHHEVAPSPEW